MEKLNWEKRIEMAKKNGHFTEDDKEKAISWDTCAVGEIFNIKNIKNYVKYNYGNKIYDLGEEFTFTILNDNILRAEKCFITIKKLKELSDKINDY
jgi:hypothetical protein